MSRFLVLIVFLVVVVGVGLGLGYLFPAGDWYASLQKPVFTPPDILFAYVWPVLYVLIAVAGWRVFITSIGGGAWGLWLVNLILNYLYTPVFFEWHQLGWSAVLTFATLFTGIAFVSATWHRDRFAAAVYIPYVLWLGYAFTLAVTIWWLNGAGTTTVPITSG